MKIAVVGASGIARYVMPCWRDAPGLRFTALCSRSDVGGLAREYGIEKVYADYGRLLADGNADTIYLALPNHLHYPYARQALLAGKHVIVEKPFTSAAWESANLAALSRERRLFLWEAVTLMHLPVYFRMRSLLPALGAIKMIQCSYCRVSSRYAALKQGLHTNVFSLESAGGALMDLNIYNLHLVIGLLGMPAAMTYRPNLAANGIDTSGAAVLTYPGAVCVCAASKDAGGPQFCSVQGECGELYMDELPMACKTIRLRAGGGEQVIFVENPHGLFQYEIREFIRQLDECDYEACQRLMDHSLRVMETVTRLRRDAGIFFPADEQEGQ
jgi:predicted dehydrogenase